MAKVAVWVLSLHLHLLWDLYTWNTSHWRRCHGNTGASTVMLHCLSATFAQRRRRWHCTRIVQSSKSWKMLILKLLSMTVSYVLSFFSSTAFPLSSDRQHLSYDDCLEVRGEIIRTILCCIVYWKLCTVISTLRWAVLTVLWIGFCLAEPISLCVDSCVYVYFCVVLSYCICVVLL